MFSDELSLEVAALKVVLLSLYEEACGVMML